MKAIEFPDQIESLQMQIDQWRRRAIDAEERLMIAREALEDIEGGLFGDHDNAIDRNWKRMYEALQQIARSVLNR